jgi:putative acetyltransferase
MPVVRRERPEDFEAVRRVLEAAFGGEVEALLVERLRRRDDVLSLVAEEEGRVVGHIMFSPVTIGQEVPAPGSVVVLAPMAVLPERQRQGIGSALIRAGLEACRQANHCAVVVLGHPDYYPRFGFRRASDFGLRYEEPHYSPEEIEAAFFALELVPGALSGVSGVVRSGPEFEGL